MSERRTNTAALVLIGLLMVPLTYVISYYALVTQSVETERNTDNELMFLPEYRLGGSAAKRIYFPMYMADRNLREDVWTSVPITPPNAAAE